MTWMGLWGFLNCCMCQAETMNIKIERPVSGSELVGDNDNSDDREWEEVFIPPGIKGVVFLNLLTYAGGRNIWGTSQSVGNEIDKGQSSLADGMIELVGIDSSFHLSQMVLEVSRGVRLARMNECKITCSDIHIQLDGEPWEEHPVTYHIRPLPQARMLHRPDYTEPCC